MLALAILLFGLLLVFAIAAIALLFLGLAPLLAWVIPIVPGLVLMGTVLLAVIELPLFLGGAEDRKQAKTDMVLFGLTILISAVLSYGAAFVLWR